MKSYSVVRFNINNNALKQNYLLLKRIFCNKAKEKPKSKEKWNTVVGLEIHAQIATNSKLFSGATTKFGNPVNSSVSFFDCATPGTLPVLNKKCVEAGVLTALALSCKLNEISLFDRKHYFYADLPAGYQITQQRKPLATEGQINFHVFTPGVHKEPYHKSSKLKQIQLEQDSGKTLQDEITKKNFIDLNRAGIPLMEFVFEPDLNDGEEAAALVKELILILKRLETCSCKMAEGVLRVDANVSINKPGEPLGVRTELKNIGSIRAVASSVNYEIKRQIKARENKEEIINETRAWDAHSGKTISMRDKESKQDYRFMPEPNLPPLHIHLDENSENKNNLIDATILKTQIPEMPQETRDKLALKYNLPKALIIVLVNTPELLKLFMYLTENNKNRTPKIVAKILIYDVLKFLYDHELDLEYCYSIQDHIGESIDLLQSGSINLLVLNKIFEKILDNPKLSPREIVEKNKWIQINDEKELEKICQEILDKHPDLVQKYKRGKKRFYRIFMTEVVKATDERANMKLADKIMTKLLE